MSAITGGRTPAHASVGQIHGDLPVSDLVTLTRKGEQQAWDALNRAVRAAACFRGQLTEYEQKYGELPLPTTDRGDRHANTTAPATAFTGGKDPSSAPATTIRRSGGQTWSKTTPTASGTSPAAGEGAGPALPIQSRERNHGHVHQITYSSLAPCRLRWHRCGHRGGGCGQHAGRCDRSAGVCRPPVR